MALRLRCIPRSGRGGQSLLFSRFSRRLGVSIQPRFLLLHVVVLTLALVKGSGGVEARLQGIEMT